MSQRLLPRLAPAALILIIVSCFLPWETAGDFIRYQTPGLALSFKWVYAAHGRWTLPVVQDHGGLIILLLSLTLTVAMSLRAEEREPAMPAILLLSALLAALSLAHLADVLIRAAQSLAADAPEVGVGLLLLCGGSLGLLVLLLIASLSSTVPSKPGH